MQRLVFIADIDEEFTELGTFFEELNDTVTTWLDCKVVRSKLETPDEVYENGEWEDEDPVSNDTLSDSQDDLLRNIGEKFMELRNTSRKMHFGNRTMEDVKKAAQNMSEMCMMFIKSIETKGESKDE